MQSTSVDFRRPLTPEKPHLSSTCTIDETQRTDGCSIPWPIAPDPVLAISQKLTDETFRQANTVPFSCLGKVLDWRSACWISQTLPLDRIVYIFPKFHLLARVSLQTYGSDTANRHGERYSQDKPSRGPCPEKIPAHCGPKYDSQPQRLKGTSPRNPPGVVNIVDFTTSEISAADVNFFFGPRTMLPSCFK